VLVELEVAHDAADVTGTVLGVGSADVDLGFGLVLELAGAAG